MKNKILILLPLLLLSLPARAVVSVTTNYAGVVSLTNAANKYGGSFTGDGGALTKLQGTNVINVRQVVNVRNYGAGTGNVTTDTNAIAFALADAKKLHVPLYFPAGEYYMQTVIDNTYSLLTNGITYTGPMLLGDGPASIIHPAFTNSVALTLTNAVNNVILQGLNFISYGKTFNTTGYLLKIYGASGTVDSFHARNCWFQGAWIAINVFVMSASSFEDCHFTGNHICGVFDQGGGESNNNDKFSGGEITGNDTGFYMVGTWNINNVEGGAQFCTNVFIFTNSSQSTINFKGGNFEVWAGALVLATNASPVSVSIDGTRVADGSGAVNPTYFFDDQTINGGCDLTIINGRFCSLPTRIGTGDYFNYPSVTSLGSANISIEKPTHETNAIGIFRELSAGIVNAASQNLQGKLLYVNTYSGTRAMPFVLMPTNALGVQMPIGLAAYAYDKVDGKVADPTGANNWQQIGSKISGATSLNGYDYGWGLDPASSGRAVRFGMGQVGYDEWFVSSASAHGGTPNHYNIYFDTSANIMRVYGTLTATNMALVLATNATTPVSTVVIKAWVNVTNAADGSIYKMPLYQ